MGVQNESLGIFPILLSGFFRTTHVMTIFVNKRDGTE